MIIIKTDDVDINVSDDDIRKSVDAYVCHYIHHELHTGTGRGYWDKRGEAVIDEMIREAVSMEVKTMIACQLDKIVKKAISNTAISIRNNPKYAVIREAVADALAEVDIPQTDCAWK